MKKLGLGLVFTALICSCGPNSSENGNSGNSPAQLNQPRQQDQQPKIETSSLTSQAKARLAHPDHLSFEYFSAGLFSLSNDTIRFKWVNDRQLSQECIYVVPNAALRWHHAKKEDYELVFFKLYSQLISLAKEVHRYIEIDCTTVAPALVLSVSDKKL